MDTCAICLDEIKDNHIIKTLSCNHKFHFVCFKNMVNQKNGNFFINCPLCRHMNMNCKKPTLNDKDNIRLLSHSALSQGIKCNCSTVKGTRCKNKALLLNYGKCYSHNTNILKEKHYHLMSKWLYHIFQTDYSYLSKIHLIDFGKKIIIEKFNELTGIEDILYYLYCYYNYTNQSYMDGIFIHYNLQEPPKNWVKYCVNNKVVL